MAAGIARGGVALGRLDVGNWPLLCTPFIRRASRLLLLLLLLLLAIILAKNANKVVSHDELLSEVWPDTVVTPNTLQRSIAQLRKALGESNLSYIKTHAKQGYSLEVEVRWQDKIDAESLIGQENLLETHAVKDDTTAEHGVAQPHRFRKDSNGGRIDQALGIGQQCRFMVGQAHTAHDRVVPGHRLVCVHGP